MCKCFVFSSPGFCGKQLIIVGGALVVILSVSDDCGEAFTDKSFCYVSGRRRRSFQHLLRGKERHTQKENIVPIDWSLMWDHPQKMAQFQFQWNKEPDVVSEQLLVRVCLRQHFYGNFSHQSGVSALKVRNPYHFKTGDTKSIKCWKGGTQYFCWSSWFVRL